jgi:hypothetical protein
VNALEFQRKWLANTQKERSASQPHFLDLCALVGHPTPSEMDPAGEVFAFEKGASKLRGGQGWADVWYRGHFAIEYKGLVKDLKAAYNQLAQYHEDLENPPLLIVSDLNHIEIHTNFTNTVKQIHSIDLSTITDSESVRVLKAAFFDPGGARPGGVGGLWVGRIRSGDGGRVHDIGAAAGAQPGAGVGIIIVAGQ